MKSRDQTSKANRDDARLASGPHNGNVMSGSSSAQTVSAVILGESRCNQSLDNSRRIIVSGPQGWAQSDN